MKNANQPRFAMKSLFAATLACYAPFGMANPTDGTVVSGGATIVKHGNSLVITNTPGTIINWKSFSIDPNELTRFVQQSGNSAVLNRITGQDPSNILGQLQSNGRVFLINPNGIVFGQGAQIDTAGLVASTLNIRDEDFQAGKFRFEGANTGSIQNAANITTPSGGFVYLIAPAIENNGVIVSPSGEILLAAGSSVELVDGVDTSLRVKLAATGGTALNVGQLIAEQGRIGVFAAAIRQQGLVSASRAEAGADGAVYFRASQSIDLAEGSITRSQGGVVSIDTSNGDTTIEGLVDVSNTTGKGGSIELLGNRVGLFGTATVDASGRDGGGSVLIGGDFQGGNAAIHNAQQTVFAKTARLDASATGQGNGGKLVIWADGVTSAYGSIAAKGGAKGGNGGFVEVSGKHQLNFASQVDTSAVAGLVGTLLLDPFDLEIVSFCGSGPCTLLTYPVAFGDGPTTGVSTIDASILDGQSGNVVLNASNNITIGAGASVNSTSAISLQANNDVIVKGTLSSSLNVNVNAGHDINIQSGGYIRSGGGALLSRSVNTFSTFTINTAANINLTAGNKIDMSGGSVSAAGDISMSAKGINLQAYTSTAATGGIDLSASGLDAGISSIVVDGTMQSSAASITLNSSQGSISVGSNAGASASLSSYNPIDITAATDITVGASANISSTNTLLLSAGHDVVLNHSIGSTGGSAIVSAAHAFQNNAGASALVTPNGHFEIWTNSSVNDSIGGLNPDFKQYGATYGSSTVLGSGNGFFYKELPSLSLSGSVDKVYDGNTTASISGLNSTVTNTRGDTLTFVNGTVNFGDKNVGSGKLITLSGISGVQSTGMPIYGYEGASASGFLGNITPANLIINALVNSKVYDATTTAFLTFSSNGVAGDKLNYSFTSANFADKSAGKNKPVNIIGFTLSGADAANYTYSKLASATGEITPFLLTLTGTGQNKVYDATTGALATLTSNAFKSDNLILAYGKASFADKNVGTGKQISISGITLSGADAGNYTFSPTATATGNITPYLLTLTGIGQNKVYDAGTGALVTVSGNVLSGDNLIFAYGDASFSDKNVGKQKLITVNAVTASGLDAANYSFATTLTTNGEISPASLQVTGLQVANKVYDATTNATLSGTGRVTGLSSDLVSLSGIPIVAFVDKNVGDNKVVTIGGYTLIGQDAANYVLTPVASMTANITPATVSLTGLAIAANKVYDGNDLANISSYGNLLGLYSGDKVSVSGIGRYADKNVGAGKSITIGNLTLAGVDAANYLLTTTGASAFADITRLASVSWIGGSGGAWSDPKNWAGGAIPDLQNVAAVVLPSGSSVIYDSSMVSVTDLDQILGSGTVIMRGGQLALTGSMNLFGLEQSGGRIDARDLQAAGGVTQTAGTLALSGSANVSGLQQIGGRIDARDLVVSGSLQQTAGTLALSGFANLAGLQQSGGRIEAKDMTVSKTFQQTGGAIALANAGTLSANQTVGAMLVGDVTAGTFNLKSAGDISSGIGSNLTLKGDVATLNAGGSINALQTRLNRVSLSAGGNIGLTNAVALTVLDAASGGDVRIESSGGLTTQNAVKAKGKVKLVTHSPLLIGAGGVVAGQGISLQSGTGTGNDDVTINGNLQSSAGSCEVIAGGNVAQNANISLGGNGTVTVQAIAGSLKMAANVSTSSNGGAISYQALGDVVLGVLDAGAAGQVAIGATNGTVLSAGPGLVNVLAGKLNVSANGKIDLGADVPPGQLTLNSASGYAVVRGADGGLLPGSVLPVSDSQSQGATVTGLSNVGKQLDQGADVQDDTQQKINARATTGDTNKDGNDDKRKKAKKC